MSNRYWVGGTGDWSDDDNHWATTSGGSPANGNLPTTSDDVFIDANSGFGSGGIITLDTAGDSPCHNFNSTTGHIYSITYGDGNLNVYGSLLLEAGVTFTDNINFSAIENNKTLTFNGATIQQAVQFYGTGSWILQDDLTVIGQFYQDNGTFDANDHNITANDFYLYADTGYIPTVVMGSGTWEATGGDWGVDEYSGEVVTITPETSTIKLSTNNVSFYSTSDNKTYYNLWISGATTTAVVVYDSNTFNDIRLSAGVKVNFQTNETQTVVSFTATGTVGNVITLNRLGASGQFILSKSSGVVSCDYLDISNSNATGGATWYAGNNSADTTNNDGWIFEDAPVTTSVKDIIREGFIVSSR